MAPSFFMKKLELFYYDSCPYCHLVLNTINKLNLKVDLLNIYEDSKYLNRLLQDTKRKTVPCLYIDNIPMHESRDIVDWLNKNQNSLEKRGS